MKLKLLIASLLIPIFLLAQNETKIFRFPSLSPDGKTIAFSYQGDIWTVPSTGGQANRLTIHEAYESMPEFSPDGEKILFVTERNGNQDIYTINKDGSDLKRITFHSANDAEATWKGNNTIIFTTRRNYVSVERESEFHAIPASGGTPERFLDLLGSEPEVNGAHDLMAFVRGGCRIEREAYRGPANRDIWLYNPNNQRFLEVTNDEGQDVKPQWGKSNELFFLSARNGKYNIHRTLVDLNANEVGPIEAVTNFNDEGIRHFDISADGSTLVYIKGTDVKIMNLTSGSTTDVNIGVTEDYRFDPIEHKTVNGNISDYDISPDEKLIAFTSGGDLFFKKNDKESERSINPLPKSSRETEVRWLNDETALFLSDRNGNYDIFSIKSSDEDEPNIFKSFKWSIEPIFTSSSEEIAFELSPDKSQIAIIQEPGTLIIADIDSSGNITGNKTLLDGWATPSGVSWSPDNQWLAYSLEDLNFNEEIFIHKADNSIAPVNVSMHPRGDYNPVWSMDGSKLGFLSIRNNGDADVWFAWLNEKDWEKTKDDWEEMDDEPASSKKDIKEDEEGKKEENDEPDLLTIDLEGIHERLVQVTSLAGNEGDLIIDGKGEIFLFSTNNSGRQGSGGKQEYKKVKWNGEDLENLMSDGGVGSVKLDKKGENIFYLKRGRLANVNIKSGKSENLPFSAKMDINTKEYRQQVFDEAWRTLRDRFYDPNFHGQDWNALRQKYEPMALSASTDQDFRMLVNEMLGQVNASHMGLYGSGPEETQNERTGLLGIEVKPIPNGVQITHVIPESPADKEESKLNVGDIITSVNGEGLTEDLNFYSLLNQKVDERIMLEVQRSDGTMEEMIIRPTSSLSNERYEAWIDHNKALTDKYSGGKLGYIHIRGMNWPSFERFERELMASGYGKEGIVIDVRYNGGGWTTDMVMAVLNVRQHSYTVPRGATDNLDKNHKSFKEHYPYGERLPLSALTKPSVALCNEASYSNAEIFSHAFKTLGHGKLVGQPTFGAVISTGGRGLMDGSFVRVPFRAWYVKATEENMEWGPAVPDYIIENSPETLIKQEDDQLKKAVEVLLSEIN